MKRVIYASTSPDALRTKIANSLYDLIQNDLWSQNNYYKQIRRQFTVNGRKYSVKNDAKGRLHIFNPEGQDLYGYSIPSHISSDSMDEIALDILNDAYPNQLDSSMKKVYVHFRVNSQYLSSDLVCLGKYTDVLKRWTRDGSSGRYAVTTIKNWWSGNDTNVTWFDDASEALAYAQDFIERGANSYSSTEGLGADYRYYTSVLDTETGKEIYWDRADSQPVSK